MESSAKSGLNVNELFCEIGKRLYKETEKQNNTQISQEEPKNL